MSAFTIDRRRLLAGVGGSALLLGAGGLTACGSSSEDEKNTATVNQGVKLPSYIAYQGVKPDFPATSAGVDPAFKTFPTDNPTSVEETPGKGETLTGMANIYYAVPPGPSNNSYWAGLNKKMGVDLQLQMVSNADYTQKFATTIAGNELPDMLQMQVVANFPSLLDKRFTDLTEHLSGDAIKDYPNLANIPTRTWKSAVYNGGIYGIPIPRGAIGSYNFVRQDLFEAKGLSLDIKGYDAMLDAGKELTDPKKRRWAFGLATQVRQYFQRLNEEPNAWRVDGDNLVNAYETEEYKQSVSDMAAFWKAGVMHPDAFDPAMPFKPLFNAGTVAVNFNDGYPGWTQYILDNANNPDFKLGLLPVYKRDGSDLAPWLLGSGVYSITSLKKQDDPEKLKTILRVLNYLAAPFGTAEYLYRLYGEEGVDHTVDAQGNPSLTKSGTTNTVIPIRYLADSPYTVYQPGRPDDAKVQYDYQSLEVPTGVANPTVGLFSNTAATKNATADKNFTDGVNEIIQGRQPISKLDDLLSTWKNQAGDGMRKDYLDQLNKAGSSQSPK